jgi:hypothetical protein
MKTQSETEKFAASIRETASVAQCVVVEGFPSSGSNFVSVTLDISEMLRLLSVVKPRLIYLYEDWFDCASSMTDLSDELVGGDSADLDISPLSALKRYGKAYDGALCLVYVGFMSDSVLHLSFQEAEWYEDFQEEASELVERLKAVILENRAIISLT